MPKIAQRRAERSSLQNNSDVEKSKGGRILESPEACIQGPSRGIRLPLTAVSNAQEHQDTQHDTGDNDGYTDLPRFAVAIIIVVAAGFEPFVITVSLSNQETADLGTLDSHAGIDALERLLHGDIAIRDWREGARNVRVRSDGGGHIRVTLVDLG